VYERGGSRDHRVELKNLHPGKTYHYEVLTRHGKDRLNGEFQTK
jgi:phosphodiesterase/alkaline phosphatase D-like protein